MSKKLNFKLIRTFPMKFLSKSKMTNYNRPTIMKSNPIMWLMSSNKTKMKFSPCSKMTRLLMSRSRLKRSTPTRTSKMSKSSMTIKLMRKFKRRVARLTMISIRDTKKKEQNTSIEWLRSILVNWIKIWNIFKYKISRGDKIMTS